MNFKEFCFLSEITGHGTKRLRTNLENAFSSFSDADKILGEIKKRLEFAEKTWNKGSYGIQIIKPFNYVINDLGERLELNNPALLKMVKDPYQREVVDTGNMVVAVIRDGRVITTFIKRSPDLEYTGQIPHVSIGERFNPGVFDVDKVIKYDEFNRVYTNKEEADKIRKSLQFLKPKEPTKPKWTFKGGL